MTTENKQTHTPAKSWLWPDRTIGKAESRALREEHNALVNVAAKLAENAEAMFEDLRWCVGLIRREGYDAAADRITEYLNKIESTPGAAILKAEGKE